MTNTLYLFVTSERPDQYLNPILHCLLNEDITEISFLYVKGSNNKTGAEEGISAKVEYNVRTLLSELATRGDYRYFTGKDSGKSINLLDYYPASKFEQAKNIYKMILEKSLKSPVSWTHKDINYQDAKNYISNINKQKTSSIFDVTAVSKALLGDILAICIINGINKVYTFDLNMKPNYDEPWKMLFHEIHKEKEQERKYKYTNIVNTEIFRQCSNSILVRTFPLKLSVVITVIFLIILIPINFTLGPSSLIMQLVSLFTVAAGFLSIYYNFFPPRRG